jgi:hypothetical protein
MDAFLEDKPCFLDTSQWREVMHSAILNDDTFNGYKDLVISLWDALVYGPRLFRDVTDIILSPTEPAQTAIKDLLSRLRRDEKSLRLWFHMAQTKMKCNQAEDDEEDTLFLWPKAWKTDLSPNHIVRLVLWGTHTMCRIVKSRLIVALEPSRFHQLESECQFLAQRILDMGASPTGKANKWLVESLFMSQSLWIAKGVVETKDVWASGIEKKEGVIEKWKFEAWCKAIGRKYPTQEGR